MLGVSDPANAAPGSPPRPAASTKRHTDVGKHLSPSSAARNPTWEMLESNSMHGTGSCPTCREAAQAWKPCGAVWVRHPSCSFVPPGNEQQ